MYVYVVCEAAGLRPSKVGRTRDMSARLVNLQNGNSRKLRLWWHAYVSQPIRVERRAHSLLLRKRIRGEWFDVTAARAVEAVEEALVLTRARIEPAPPVPALPTYELQGREAAISYVPPPISKDPSQVTAEDIIAALEETGPIPDYRKDRRGYTAINKRLATILGRRGCSVNSIASALGTSPRIVGTWVRG